MRSDAARSPKIDGGVDQDLDYQGLLALTISGISALVGGIRIVNAVRKDSVGRGRGTIENSKRFRHRL